MRRLGTQRQRKKSRGASIATTFARTFEKPESASLAAICVVGLRENVDESFNPSRPSPPGMTISVICGSATSNTSVGVEAGSALSAGAGTTTTSAPDA